MALAMVQLGVLFVLGMWTSYIDMRDRKVRNKHLAVLLAFVTAIIVFRVLYDDYDGFLVLMHFTVTLAFGVLLWWMNVLPAGDVKLLSVYSIAVPHELFIRIPSQLQIPYLPLLPVILLSFCVPLLLSLVRSIRTTKYTLGMFWSQEYFYDSWMMAAMLYILSPVLAEFGIPQLVVIIGYILLLYVVQSRWKEFLEEWNGEVCLLLFVLSWFMPFFSLEAYLTMMVTYIGLAFLIRTLRLCLAQQREETKASEIREGSVLAEAIDIGGNIYRPRSDGLSNDEAAALRVTGGQSILVLREIPYAPYLFVSVALLIFI